jgi:hypothetical protein
MIFSLVAAKAEHYVAFCHPVVAYFPGADSIGEPWEAIRISTANATKQIHPPSVTDCHDLFIVYEWFVTV